MFGRILFWLNKYEIDIVLKSIVIIICTIIIALTIMHYVGI